MSRWEDRLSEHHLNAATDQQRRAVAVAEAKPVDRLRLQNANNLLPHARSQAATAVATMMYHHDSYTGQMRGAPRAPSKSPARARPPWRDLSAEDKGWRQLADWHRDPHAGQKQRRAKTPSRAGEMRSASQGRGTRGRTSPGRRHSPDTAYGRSRSPAARRLNDIRRRLVASLNRSAQAHSLEADEGPPQAGADQGPQVGGGQGVHPSEGVTRPTGSQLKHAQASSRGAQQNARLLDDVAEAALHEIAFTQRSAGEPHGDSRSGERTAEAVTLVIEQPTPDSSHATSRRIRDLPAHLDALVEEVVDSSSEPGYVRPIPSGPFATVSALEASRVSTATSFRWAGTTVGVP